MKYTDYSDDELMAELSGLLALHDPVPDYVAAHAKTSFAFASPWDAALAALVYDSTNDDDEVRALVRSSSGTRELTFEGPAMSIEVEVGARESARRGRCQILGQIVPAQEATIQVRCPSEIFLVDADALGRFTITDAPVGPVSLRCTPLDGEATETEWIVI